MKRTLTIRIADELRARLERSAEDTGVSPTTLIQRLVDEGLRMETHRAVAFRPASAGGRLAGLVGGPDVAEVIQVVQGLAATGDAAVAEAARWLRLSPNLVRAAVGYYAEFGEEVDREIAHRRRAAEDAQARWEREQSLLA
jgi:hypothetical protein